MTRPLSDVREVLQLADDGLSMRAISLRTGIPRAAIREWLDDPGRALARGRRASVESMRCEARCGLWRDVNEPTYAYLLGMYLGDGWISEHARAFKLRISCADSYPLIMDEVAEAIHIVSGKDAGRVKCEGCTEVNAYWQHWPCFFPQHGPA